MRGKRIAHLVLLAIAVAMVGPASAHATSCVAGIPTPEQIVTGERPSVPAPRIEPADAVLIGAVEELDTAGNEATARVRVDWSDRLGEDQLEVRLDGVAAEAGGPVIAGAPTVGVGDRVFLYLHRVGPAWRAYMLCGPSAVLDEARARQLLDLAGAQQGSDPLAAVRNALERVLAVLRRW